MIPVPFKFDPNMNGYVARWAPGPVHTCETKLQYELRMKRSEALLKLEKAVKDLNK